MQNYKTGGYKYAVGFLVVFIIRLLPFRPANIEPVMATVMPFSKAYGPAISFLFGFLSIVLVDVAMGLVGMWTVVTAVAYGLVGLGAHYFFAKRHANTKNFLVFSLVATVLYDALTGLSVGPLFFAQPFMEALVGQIPFTLRHLFGNLAFAALVSPLLHRWIVSNEKLESPAIRKSLTAVFAR